MLPEEKNLELEIDRQLKALPELQAPASLLPRVMANIASRPALPWYRQSWSQWPMSMRRGSLAALLSTFGALCYAVSAIFDLASASVRQKVAGNFLGLASLWNVLSDLAATAFAAVQHLGTGTLVGIAAALILSYMMFLALGAAYYRLAFAPSKSYRL